MLFGHKKVIKKVLQNKINYVIKINIKLKIKWKDYASILRRNFFEEGNEKFSNMDNNRYSICSIDINDTRK